MIREFRVPKEGHVLIGPVLVYDDNWGMMCWNKVMGLTHVKCDCKDTAESARASLLASLASSDFRGIVHTFESEVEFAQYYAHLDGSRKARKTAAAVIADHKRRH
jgi:hypothetical protein